jgi:hypothetical protein
MNQQDLVLLYAIIWLVGVLGSLAYAIVLIVNVAMARRATQELVQTNKNILALLKDRVPAD